MRILIVGCGLVGTELARSLRADGHHVIGTTTTAAKVARLSEVCDEVAVLAGGDREKVHAAAAGVDAIVVTAGPAAAQAMTVEQRQRTYRQVLVDTAESVSSVPGTPHLVMLSSLSVYGDAANHLELIDESAPLTTSSDPSPAMFQEAERTYREAAGDRLTVFRCADITGGEDPPIADKVRMAHQVLGGSVPFHDEALFYRVHMLDVVRAIKYVLDHDVLGTFNLTHAEVPPRMAPYFDALSAIDGLPPLTYRNELRAPTVPCPWMPCWTRDSGSSTRRSSRCRTRTPRRRRARCPRSTAAVGSWSPRVLERLVRELGLAEETGADGDAALPLHAVGGPLDGAASASSASTPARTAYAWSTARCRSTTSGWTPTRCTSSPRPTARCRTSSSTPPSRPTPAAPSTSASTSRRVSTSARASTTSTRSTRRSPSRAPPRSPSRGSCPCRRSVRCSGRCARRG